MIFFKTACPVVRRKNAENAKRPSPPPGKNPYLFTFPFPVIATLSLLVFLLATALQCLVWWGVFGRLTRPGPAAPSGPAQPCSVLICARNESDNLRHNLRAVLEQEHPDFEVLVVDDASTDDTPAVLAFFREKYPQLRVLRIDKKTAPGKKQALAAGIAAARHDLLVFTDADCRPASRHWLTAMTAFFRRPAIEIVLGYGPVFPEKTALNYWIGYETATTALQYLSLARAGLPYMGVGRNLAWRKSLFARTGGFAAHAHLASGDDDLLVNAAARRGNTALCLDPAAFVFSEGKKTWPSWLRQKRRHLSAGPTYRPLHRAVLGAMSLSHVLHYALGGLLLAAGFGTKYVLFGYVLREFSLVIVSGLTLPKLSERRLLPYLPLLDVFLALYQALIVPVFLLQHKRPHPWT